VAYGEAARREAAASVKGLPDGMPVCVVGDGPLIGNDLTFVEFDGDPGPGARRAKLHADLLSPFQMTLYLDADTRPRGDVTVGFGPLADGWHLCMAYSGRQGYDVLGNVGGTERWQTFEEIACREPLGLQCGVMFFRRCPEVAALFATWREEWERYQGEDQGAFLRALHRQPVRIWLMGLPWNQEGGEVIDHQFGRARL
jgi:hypothetical protein